MLSFLDRNSLVFSCKDPRKNIFVYIFLCELQFLFILFEFLCDQSLFATSLI